MTSDTELRFRAARNVGIESVYILGPMSGLIDHGYQAFEEASIYLQSLGFLVNSPTAGAPTLDRIDEEVHQYGEFRGTPLYQKMMWRDLHILMSVDACVALQDWWTSRGAMTEALVAQTIGIPLLRLRDGTYITDPLKVVEDQGD